ncbi:glycosyltransferase family 2 protein, partial [Prochlorococcus sp. AH-716-I07]|nr:glycosyltransferase family 2 protein [Prochlorococcus sp. AH-716-I07]
MNISVVINCYNSEKFIAETATSLSSQSYTNFKVLFVDNQSKDNSFNIFKENSNFDFKYIQTPVFMNLYEARNFALSFIESPLVCFLDADDYWSPNYLQTINDFHEKNPNIISCQSKTFAFHKENSYRELTKNLVNKNPITPSHFANMPFTALGGLSIKSKFFRDYLFPSSSNFIGDLDLVMNLASNNNLYFLSETSFFYRIHPGGLTSKNLDIWKFELDNWLSKNKKNIPINLFKKLSNDLQYISLRTLIYKLNIFSFFF